MFLSKHVFFALALVGAVSPSLPAASNPFVISQVYGGGGNTGAPFQNDFVEIFNRSTSASAPLSGWSLQYASSTGTSTWIVSPLSGTVAPGHYFLIQLASGGTNGIPNPIPADATGTLNLSASSGKLALVNSTTPLSGPIGGVITGSETIVDLVGYGSANFSETAPAPGLSNTTADFRSSGGCSDSDNNFVDFANAPPSARNSGSGAVVCGATITSVQPSAVPAGVSSDITITGAGFSGATVELDTTALASTTVSTTTVTATVPATFAAGAYTLTVLNGDGSAPSTPFTIYSAVPISQIQGSGDTSPLVNTTIQTSGIVTALKYNGFFIQTPDGQTDNDPATSEGIFVFTSSAPPASAALGNELLVTGKVQEFSPSSDPYSPPSTELTGTTVSVLSTNNPLPLPITLTSADINPSVPYNNLERLEGMRVHVDSLTVSGPTLGSINEPNATATSNGLFFGVLTGTPRPFREPGVELPDPLPAGAPSNVPRFDDNPEHIRVDTTGAPTGVAIDVTAGAVVTNLTGALDYGYRNYSILVDPGTDIGVSGNVSATPAPAPTPDEFTISSFNLERFYDTADDPSTQDVVVTQQALDNRLQKASLAIRNILQTPDVLGVEEMENLSTLQLLASRISSDAVAAGQTDPHYQAFLVSGNDIGGINVGFLINPSKIAIQNVTQFGKDTTYIDPSTGQPAILNDRPPLLLQATVGRPGSDIQLPLTVIVNHLRSLSGISDPADGGRVRAKREAQAEFLANLVQQNQSSGYLASVGDYNAYQFNDGYADVIGAVSGSPAPADQVVLPSPDLVDPNLIDLIDTLDPSQKYSYSFDGDAEALDHILVNTTLAAKLTRFAYARVDADFPEIYHGDPTRPERISDHDPDIAYFRLPPPEITDQLQIKASKVLYSPKNQVYYSFVRITNNTSTPISGPFQILLSGLPSGVTVYNASGMVNGAPYITNTKVPALNPGQTTFVVPIFIDPARPSKLLIAL